MPHPPLASTHGTPPAPPPGRLFSTVMSVMVRTQLLLRWLYTGRLVLVAAIFLAALVNWHVTPYAVEPLLATVALLSALAMTAFGVWWVELRGRGPGRSFLYLQVLYDTLLVTAVVFITGSETSPFAPLYILVITAAALLLQIGRAHV